MRLILNNAVSIEKHHLIDIVIKNPLRWKMIRLISMVILLSSGLAYSQFLPEKFSSYRSGEKLKDMLVSGTLPLQVDTVTDDKFSLMEAGSSWRNTFKHRSVLNRITLTVKDTVKAMQKFDYILSFTVDTFNSSNQRGSFDIIMRVSYDPESHKPYTDKSIFQFYSSHRVILKLTGIIDSSLVNPTSFSASSMQTNFTIESEIISERYYLAPYSETVDSLRHSFIGKDKLRISWVPPLSCSPNRYELEWAYIDTSGVLQDSLKYNFTLNSSRVQVSNTYFDINTVYDAGIILYRVRRVRPDSVFFKYDKYGDWFPIGNPDRGFVSNYSANKVYIHSHESMGKNWDYQVAFAEGGLKKEVVNYFDGSLKRRQGVTLSNSNNFTLVDESIYDFHGREVIKIIPSPTDSSTIKFYKDFNLNQDGDPYSAVDFDSSDTMQDKCNGEYKAQPLGTQNGAGRYYSTSNPDKSGMNAAIPDAGGYPMVQTQLLPDPTGRVAAQGGIGIAHQLGSGHETRYNYGTSTQTELDRYFGSEMGLTSHYKKNSITDPNGQVSISYIDQHGRVVATSLAGGVPGMVDTLGNYKAPVFRMESLVENNRMVRNSLLVQYGFEVFNTGTHKIHYRLESPDFVFGCVGLNQCYTCRYDLELILSDDCGNTLLDFKRTIGNLCDTSCGDFEFNLKDSISSILGTVTSDGDSISFSLNAGKYNLIKILSVNTDSIEQKIDEILYNDSTCYKSIGDFIEEELDKIDLSDCYCDTCDADSMTYCDTRRLLMLEDLTPGGQYSSYDELTYTVEDSTSILRDYGSGFFFQYVNGSYFKDYEGNPDTVWINGIPYLPSQLQIEEFVTNFKESWGSALLPYHPEYCYYKYCIDSLQDSYIYDEVMMEIDNYDTALYYGYLNPLGYRKDYPKTYTDPLFVKNDNMNYRGWEMKSALEDLNPYTIGNTQDALLIGASTGDLWQLSKAIGYCEGISDTFERQACFRLRYADSINVNAWMDDAFGRDNYWDKFKTLYFQFKQKYIEDLMNDEISGDFCVRNIGHGCSDVKYQNKTSHFVRYNNLNYEDSLSLLKSELLDSMEHSGTCEASLAYWEEALSQCEDFSAHKDSILYHFLKICKAGGQNPTAPNILGASIIPDDLKGNLQYASFDEVLRHFIGENYINEWCNVDLISMPRSYSTDFENNSGIGANDCICENVKEEIKLFKGCYSLKDSLELGIEGQLVNEFINLMVDNNLLAITDNTARDLNSFAGMTGMITRLFVPVIGGASSAYKIKMSSHVSYPNEKTYHIYYDVPENGCGFTFRLSPILSDFTNIDTTKKDIIRQMSDGSLYIRLSKTTGGGVGAYIYNTCFTNISKCGENLSYLELENFTNYFNDKFSSAISLKEMEKLVAECGNAGIQNIVTDEKNTIYLRYGACPEHYRNYREPKDVYLISFLNEMMRPNQYWRTGMPGFDPSDQAKRYINTMEQDFHCISGARDFLTQTKDYTNYKKTVGKHIVHDNYWWVNPRYTVDSSFFTFLLPGMLDTMRVYDTIWLNNYNNDPYFVGGFWIGSRCDATGDSSCFYSFGDPLKQLGTSGRPSVSQIDSLSNFRWDETLSENVITAFNRSTGDSIILSFRSHCKSYCNPLFSIKDIPVNYKDVYLIPGRGGFAKLSNVSASTGLNNHYGFPFMDMLNGLAISGNLVGGSNLDIRKIRKSHLINNYFDALIPTSGAYAFTEVQSTKYAFTGKLGRQDGTDTLYCSFGLVKSDTTETWNFSSIDVFKNLSADGDAIADALKNDRMDMSGYHFTLKAGNINSPVDTTWYDVKGWSSCWKFFEISAISANSKMIFNLPEQFTANCSCLGCEESKLIFDSLRADYPNLHPRHSNYETIVTNYVNRKMNSSLSFIEIQSHWDACGLGYGNFIDVPESDYRLSVKNSDCIGHADSALEYILDVFDFGFSYRSIRYSDSMEYLFDFSGMRSFEIEAIKDTLMKYFNSPYCNAFKHWEYFRRDFDVVIFNLDSASTLSTTHSLSGFNTWFDSVKFNLFGNSSNLVKQDFDEISYSEDNFIQNASSSNWMSGIKFRDMSESHRISFEDTLRRWVDGYGIFEIRRNYYTPELINYNSGEEICLLDSIDTVCLSCDTIRRTIMQYQLGLYGDSISPRLAMSSGYLQQYLVNKTGYDLNVYEGPGTCVSCSNKSIFVCNQPSGKLLNVISLLNRIAKLKRLNSSNYSLNSSFTSLLNELKPEGAVLNSPEYRFSTNSLGGWNITIRYNSINSDVLFVNIDTNDFQKSFNPGIDTFKQLRPIIENGQIDGFILDGMDSLYRNFTFSFHMTGLKAYECCELPVSVLCPRPFTREFDRYEPPCKEDEILQAIDAGSLRYYSYLDSLRTNLKTEYHLHCMSKSRENFQFGHFIQRYHSTLYYYDQAGNLVKTVPPQGVNELDLSANRTDSIASYRKDLTQESDFVNTLHSLSTVYRYNALNQLIWQKTPDGGESRFWYDRLGRLILSQNSVQFANSGSVQKIYSYTIYDDLGRISEVGEISNRVVSLDSLINDLGYFNQWLEGSKVRSQITRTFYDTPITEGIESQFIEGQRNLRGRVSSVCYFNSYASADTTAYTRASHYSYDIHGNVDHLVHDFPDMDQLGHRFKHITYTYDLISGKVHLVSYQPGKSDRWFHRYDYDSDNRLILAETSHDSIIWDKDAEYIYYKHGPLARVILGEHAVQGVDYAYTIHGWLKGVNSNTLVGGRDVGKDGTGAMRRYTARDAFGFTLGYYSDLTGGSFDGDYKGIGTTDFEASISSSPIYSGGANLYNGNISHMVNAVSALLPLNSGSPLATIYRYDQLNRIKGVRTFNGIDLDSNKWDPGTFSTSWNESFDFDANGNITKLLRYGSTSVMDNLSYNYKSGTNQLTSVDDTVASVRFLSDVDDQLNNNYRYDRIGNLTHDSAEEIDSIYWNVYGKISKIVRTAESIRPSLEFEYDAMGQRVLKVVKKGELEKDWNYTWYVRDAQGNIMATYTKKNIVENLGDSSLYRTINNSIVDQMNTDSLAELIKQYFTGTQLISNLSNEIVNREFLDELFDLYDEDSILYYDSGYARDVLDYFCDYESDAGNRNTFLQLLWSVQKDSIIEMFGKGCLDANVVIASVLNYDISSDELLNSIATLDYGRFDQLFQMSGGTPPPPILSVSDMINQIRTNPDMSVSNNINSLFGLDELESILKGMTSSIIDSVFLNLDVCELTDDIASCAFDNTWYDFVVGQVDETLVKEIIFGISEPNFLSGLLLAKDEKALNKVASVEKDLISDVLRQEENLDVLTYLMYIYKRFGRDVFNQVVEDLNGEITIRKTLTLDELHIYGSSRHGVRKPKQLVVSKAYELQEIGESGELSGIGYAQDSTLPVYSTRYFSRKLTLKQYELSNHLGNVLATILDRKTPQIDSLSGDTLLYYSADVSTAQYYYAYGSVISELSYQYVDAGDTAGYRFGFNNQEKHDELGGFNEYKFRFYNSNTGRFISMDPLSNAYPSNSTYAFAENNVIKFIDLEGLEIGEPGNNSYHAAILLVAKNPAEAESRYQSENKATADVIGYAPIYGITTAFGVYYLYSAGVGVYWWAIRNPYLAYGVATTTAGLLDPDPNGSFNMPGPLDEFGRVVGQAFRHGQKLFYKGGQLFAQYTRGHSVNFVSKIKLYGGNAIKLIANKTTTVLGKTKDLSNVRRLGMHRQGANNGSMNLLNGDELWDKIASKYTPLADGKLSISDLQKVQKEFFETVNLPWLKDAITRGDQIRIISDYLDPKLLFNNGKDKTEGFTCFGMEINYLVESGYSIINGVAVKQ